MKKLSPAKRKRVEYFSITTAVFFSTALVISLIFWLVSSIAYSTSENTEAVDFPIPAAAIGLIAGVLYGLIISMMIGAVMLFARFMSDKSLGLKITAAVLWPITYMCIAFVMYATIPYWVYNTVKMFMREKEPEVLWSAENYSSFAEQSTAQLAAIVQPAVGADAVAIPAPAAAPEEAVAVRNEDTQPETETSPIVEATPKIEE